MKRILVVTAIVAAVATVKADDSAMTTGNSGASSETAGLQLSLTPDVALHPRTTTIRGLSLNIWGENPQHGLTLGIVNGSTGDSSGFSLAWGINYADSYTGVQWGLANISKTRFVGWQAGAVNYAAGSFTGLQTGFINVTEDAKGLQWGAINYTDRMNGVQIGFINVITDNSWFNDMPDKLATAFPIVNWSF